ncbi:retrovirus-related Pol polyprotein from transposon TNT 1-94 [Trichonephila clavipes]|nr:retrovirus-related Pol polyprotein from transposon TNT 1-94 [Trichonephila clavipes]
MFGVHVSPFLLSETIKHHIDNYREQYPAATDILDTCLFVDDVISGADDFSQALKELPTGVNGSGKSNFCCDITMCIYVVCGDRKCPSLPAEASSEAVAAHVKAQKAFIKDDSLAQLILVGNMDDSNAELTSICDTANCVWEKLLSVYEQSYGQRLDRLMEKFFHNDKELEDGIVSHIAKLQRNFSELNDDLRRVAKTTLPDLLLMSRIMSTLPSEYFEFKSVWESVSIEERSVNKLTERLRLIEMRLPSKSANSKALVATRKGWILDKHTAWRQKFWRQIFGDKVYNMATLPDCPVRWLKYGNPKTGQPKKSGEKWTSFIFALDPAATRRVRPCSYFLPHVFRF